jgi:hypothetical protein
MSFSIIARTMSVRGFAVVLSVYTLISVDDKLKLPRNFDLADLEAASATLQWNAEQKRFGWKQSTLSELPLTLESPPADQQFTDIVRSVGHV